MTDYTIDFGFEGKAALWEDAQMVLLFASNAAAAEVETAPGPTALADASRYIELYEMQVGISPMDIGVYAEVIGGPDPIARACARSKAAVREGKTPVLVGGNRRVTEDGDTQPLITMWGTMGRPEVDESALFAGRQVVLVGVRAASYSAFQAIGAGDVAVVTPKAFKEDADSLGSVLEKIETPVHLSIDYDVLAPAVAQNRRSIEPGGFSWYELMSILASVFKGPGVSFIDITGTEQIQPRTAAASLGAQLITNLAGLVRTNKTP